MSSEVAAALLDLLFEEPGLGRCLIAPDGRVLRASPEWLRATGLPLDQVQGADVLRLLAGDSALARALRAPAPAGGRVALPRHARRVGGRETWWDGSVAPLPMDGGTGLLVTLRELEPKGSLEALQESEQSFRALTDAMPQIVCALAWDGTPEYVNTSWVAYSGLDLEGSARASWLGILHPEDVAAAAECLRRTRELRTPQDVELRYRAADGSYRWFLSRLAPIVVGGGVVRFIGAAMDIDDRRRAEAERERLLAAAREADRRKDEFLGMLSHELRNPLAPIRNAVYILEHTDPSGEQAAAARAVIERQAEHLTRLVDDLLDVTRIARGKIQLRRQRVELRAVVRGAAEDLRPLLQARNVAFRMTLPEGELWTDADPTRITQIVGNLLHNAAKFTRAADEVSLSLRVDGGEAELSVRDTGAGIDPALLPQVFDIFVQGERTLARTEGGLGLGLALVKGIAALHGGTVRAASAGKGKGAEFVVRLPLVASAAVQPSPRAPPPRASGGGRRVLVVDDNRDGAESLAQLVALFGHSPEVAYDGPSALEKARASPFDVVLCDIGLPGMSGYEVARVLRGSALPRLELIAVSGYAQPEDLKAALEAGFDRHLAKPASPEDIERLLLTP